jgi:hypothetical protein
MKKKIAKRLLSISGTLVSVAHKLSWIAHNLNAKK